MRNTWSSIKHSVHTIFCERKNFIVDQFGIERYNGGDITDVFMDYIRKEINMDKHDLYTILLVSDDAFISFLDDSGFIDFYIEENQPASYESLGIH